MVAGLLLLARYAPSRSGSMTIASGSYRLPRAILLPRPPLVPLRRNRPVPRSGVVESLRCPCLLRDGELARGGDIAYRPRIPARLFLLVLRSSRSPSPRQLFGSA